MEKNDIIKKFNLLYDDAVHSGDPDDSKISFAMFKIAMHRLIEVDQENAQSMVEQYEGSLNYYNFLTESEANTITSGFVNADGSKGAKWTMEEVANAVKRVGGILEDDPYYNKWALYVTINMFYSDQSPTIKKWIGDTELKQFEFCYDMAFHQLHDEDRPYWIRYYFGLDSMA